MHALILTVLFMLQAKAPIVEELEDELLGVQAQAAAAYNARVQVRCAVVQRRNTGTTWLRGVVAYCLCTFIWPCRFTKVPLLVNKSLAASLSPRTMAVRKEDRPDEPCSGVSWALWPQ